MRTGISITLKPADRRRLKALARDRSALHKHVWRAEIVLFSADDVGTNEIMRRTGKSKTCVWRWQERFMQEGYRRSPARQDAAFADPTTGIEHHRARRDAHPDRSASRGDPLDLRHDGESRRYQREFRPTHLTCARPSAAPGEPFKLSTDPQFVGKLRDIVGLYVDPPAHAVVLSVDEKSQIQALDRTQPGLPMKKGRAGTMTHDYKRHGTTTLFAALNVLDGTVIGRNMQRHRHQEFIRFLNAIEAQVPSRKKIHAIVDNYATHKRPKVRQWLARDPRWTFHFTP